MLVICVTSDGYAQKQKDDQIFFQVFCGYDTETSQEIQTLQAVSGLKDSVTVRKLLLEGSDYEQVLSAILLSHYSFNGLLKLSPGEVDKIDAIAHSKRKFILCYTCTFYSEGTLKQLFNERRYSDSYEIIKNYLLNGF